MLQDVEVRVLFRAPISQKKPRNPIGLCGFCLRWFYSSLAFLGHGLKLRNSESVLHQSGQSTANRASDGPWEDREKFEPISRRCAWLGKADGRVGKSQRTGCPLCFSPKDASSRINRPQTESNTIGRLLTSVRRHQALDPGMIHRSFIPSWVLLAFPPPLLRPLGSGT